MSPSKQKGFEEILQAYVVPFHQNFKVNKEETMPVPKKERPTSNSIPSTEEQMSPQLPQPQEFHQHLRHSLGAQCE